MVELFQNKEGYIYVSLVSFDVISIRNIYFRPILGIVNLINSYLRTSLKGMNVVYDFGCSYPLFSSLLKKRGKKKRRMNSRNRDQKSCLSARSNCCYETLETKLDNIHRRSKLFLSLTIYNI